MKRLGLVFDNRYLHHVINSPTPENPGRLRSLYMKLQQDQGRVFLHVPPDIVPLTEITRVHSEFYLDQLRQHSLSDNPFSYDRDTYLMEDSIYTAQLACGGGLALADKIMAGEIDYGFALVRPPGHHATPGRGMGFCIFNNVALTAEYLLRVYGLKRILVIDYDVHHGNGTQEIFYSSNKVLFFSIHQKGLFPFTGDPGELGGEEGHGFTVNVPVPPGFGDAEYTCIVGSLLQTLVAQYLPQFILVSAGFDAHIDDSISATELSTRWFGQVTHMLRRHAAEVCGNRLLMILEGGYNPLALEDSALETIDALLCEKISPPGIFQTPRADKVMAGHPMHKFWTL